MIKTIAPQYLNQNAGRRYPLADDSETTFYDGSTEIVIPDNAILDFKCTLHDVRLDGIPVAVLTRVWTDSGSTHKMACVTVRCNGEDITELQFDVPEDIARNAPYTAYAESTLATGAMVVTSAFVGIHSGYVNAEFSRTTVAAASLRVASIQSSYSILPGGTAEISGDVIVTDGKNAEPYLDGNSLRLDIFKGAGLGEECQSTSQEQTCDNVMFTINGERPGSDGELRITGSGGITVKPLPDDNTVEIGLSDTAVDTMDEQCESACN